MGVIKEYRCYGHGDFESEEPVCPKGCTLVERIFLTPVGHIGQASKNIDSTLSMIADSYGLTDMNNRGGRGARVHSTETRNAMQNQEAYGNFLKKRFGAQSLVNTRDGTGAWGSVGRGGVYRAGGGGVVETDRGPGAPAATQAIGAPAENQLAGVADQLGKPRVVRHYHKGGDNDLPKVA